MNLADLRTEVLTVAGYNEADGMTTPEVLTSFLNRAVRTFTMHHDWDWDYHMENLLTSPGQSRYPLPADHRKTDRVLDQETHQLVLPMAKQQAVKYERYGSYAAQNVDVPPQAWYVEAGHLVIVPTPRFVREIDHFYVGSAVPLVDDTDEPNVPDYAIDAIISLAALYVATRMDDTSQKQLLERDYLRIVQDLQNEPTRMRGPRITNSRRDWRL